MMSKTCKAKVRTGVVCLLVLLFALTGCGDGRGVSKYVGTWELSGGKAGDVSLPKTQITEQIGEVSMTIRADGTVEKTGIGLDATGTWKETEDGVSVSDQDGSNIVTFIDSEEDGITGAVKGLNLILKKKES